MGFRILALRVLGNPRADQRPNYKAAHIAGESLNASAVAWNFESLKAFTLAPDSWQKPDAWTLLDINSRKGRLSEREGRVPCRYKAAEF